MPGLNRVYLIGNLGHRPEVKTTNGNVVANFTMATNVGSREKRRTEWHRILTFGKAAEFCGDYLEKGDLVFVEGALQTREWTARDGGSRTTTEIVTWNVQSLRQKQAPSSPGAGATDRGEGSTSAEFRPDPGLAPIQVDDDETPF